METFIFFDNGGRTFDRFTILNKQTGEVYAASEDPASPDGIGKCCGNCADRRIIMYGAGWRQRLPVKKVIQTEVGNFINNARMNADWIGLVIDFKDLPENLRNWVSQINHCPQANTLA